MIARACLLVYLVAIAGCSVAFKLRIDNDTTAKVVLVSSGRSTTILPGSRRKIPYPDSHLVVVFENGITQCYRFSVSDLRKDWGFYQDDFICGRSHMDVAITAQKKLELLPCGEGVEPRILQRVSDSRD